VKAMGDTLPTRAPCKYDRVTNTTVTSLPAANLLHNQLTAVFGPTGSTFGAFGLGPNVRLSDRINIRGFSINFWVMNTHKEVPMIVHWAVVRHKMSESASAPIVDFFRDYNLSKDLDFNAPLYADSYHDLPLNPKVWNVLTHRKFVLGRSNGAATGSPWYNPSMDGCTMKGQTNCGAINCRRVKAYIPFKQPALYDDDASSQMYPRPIFWILWCAPPASFDGSPMDKTSDVLKIRIDNRTVFRDIL